MRNLISVILLFFVLAPAIAQNQEEIRYIYGYVHVERISLYMEPSLDGRQFSNYLREAGSVRTIGRYYVMQGAILRTIPLNEEWGQVVTDATWDVYEGAVVYVRYEELDLIPQSAFEPLGYLANPGSQKVIVVVINQRTITLMEGETAVFKGNVVVNPRVPDEDPEGTPRGSWILSQTSVSRDMPGRIQPDGRQLPGFPGVGWTALLSGSPEINRWGYWFHTSAWFDWPNMDINDIYEYHTGGCVSSPNWLVDVEGVGPIRADQLVWRWVGGHPQANTNIRQNLPDLIRVFIVDDISDLTYAPFTTTMRSVGINPEIFIDTVSETPLWEPME